jgi:hypothetical protein
MAENISQTQPDYYYGAQRANQIAGQAIEDGQEEDEGDEEEDEEDDETDMAYGVKRKQHFLHAILRTLAMYEDDDESEMSVAANHQRLPVKRSSSRSCRSHHNKSHKSSIHQSSAGTGSDEQSQGS